MALRSLQAAPPDHASPRKPLRHLGVGMGDADVERDEEVVVSPVRVYVAAPYADAPRVRALHDDLREAGFLPVSQWAENANGPEALETLPLSTIRALARQNDADLLSAHLVIALARDGAGGDMFAEVRCALDSKIPVLGVGA